MMGNEEVQWALEDHVLHVHLNRPMKRNALTASMFGALNSALETAASNSQARVVLISGEGSDFCAGWDSSGMDAAKDGDADLAAAGRFIRLIASTPKPIVAAVQGRAIGIGFTLLLHCDHVVVSPDARLMAPFVKLGLTPEAGSTLLLRRRIGAARAFDVLVGCKPVLAEEALAWGLINTIAAGPDLQAKASETAQNLAALPPLSVQAAKALLRQNEEILHRIDEEGRVFDVVLSANSAAAQT
jgi:enoyl-CoA hydratase/carnithine racemase